jgi:hypothetical protein
VASPAMVASIHPSAWRDCPKSLGAARGVALQIVEKARFDPFRPTHDVRINLRSVAQTPFRTVSEGEFCELRLEGVLESGNRKPYSSKPPKGFKLTSPR